MNAMSDMSEAVRAMGQGDEGEDLQWYAVRVNQPRNPNRRTVLQGASYENYRNRAGRTCQRVIKGTGKRVSVPELILRKAGFCTFQPMEKVWRQTDPRNPQRELVAKPLLTGWMFVGWAADQSRWHELTRLEVVQGLLGAAGQPARISEARIKRLMRQWGGKSQDPDYLRYMRRGCEFAEGDLVTFMEGPLSGELVKVVQIAGAQAKILFGLFGRETTQSVDLLKLRKAGPQDAAQVWGS